MKKTWILVLALFIAAGQGLAQKKAFTHPEFEVLQQTHKSLAILPIPTQWNIGELPDSLPDAHFLNAQAFKTQQILMDYFQSNRKNKRLHLELQSLTETQQRLEQARINPKNLELIAPQKLCEILGVDAIVLGNLRLEALTYPTLSKSSSFWESLTGKDFVGTLSLKISDRKSGRLLWKYAQLLAKNNGKSLEQILTDVTKKMGRKFPYFKKVSN